MLDFLQPINLENIQNPNKEWTSFQLGKHVSFNDGSGFDIEDFKLAIVGVEEDRSSTDNSGCGKGANHIRTELYQLYTHFDMPSIIDLGDIKNGQTVKDSQIALKEILKLLFEQKITVIVIGGGHDLTYGQFRAYENRLNPINVVIVDEKIDILESPIINSSSFLWHVINHQPLFLNTCTHLGHQIFYNSPKSIDILESLHHQALRLGEVRKSMIEVEPYLRDADILSMDLSAIRSSECPANAVTSPNGFTGEDACQISRFAGFSNKVSSFGLYELNPYFDNNKQGAKQASQILWYFIEGFSGRKADYPSAEDKNFMQYIVRLESADNEITFWKSTFSNRWWMEIPQTAGEVKYLPCSYSDYQTALEDELPDKWMRAYGRLGAI
jgi:formiminoglutamase